MTYNFKKSVFAQASVSIVLYGITLSLCVNSGSHNMTTLETELSWVLSVRLLSVLRGHSVFDSQ